MSGVFNSDHDYIGTHLIMLRSQPPPEYDGFLVKLFLYITLMLNTLSLAYYPRTAEHATQVQPTRASDLDIEEKA